MKKYQHFGKSHKPDFFLLPPRSRIVNPLMPLYEYRKNATNKVPVPRAVSQSVVCGTQPVLDRILALIREKTAAGHPAIVAMDGWYGVDWAGLRAGLLAAAQRAGLSLEIVSTAGLYRSATEIDAYRQPVRHGRSVVRPGQRQGRPRGHPRSAKSCRAESPARRAPGHSGRRTHRGRSGGSGGGAGRRTTTCGSTPTSPCSRCCGRCGTASSSPLAHEAPAADYAWKKYYYCDFYLLLAAEEEGLRRGWTITSRPWTRRT